MVSYQNVGTLVGLNVGTPVLKLMLSSHLDRQVSQQFDSTLVCPNIGTPNIKLMLVSQHLDGQVSCKNLGIGPVSECYEQTVTEHFSAQMLGHCPSN